MSGREDFADLLAQKIADECGGDADMAERVAARIARMCWPAVRRDYEEVDVTTLGDAEARARWSMTLVGTLTFAIQSGEYRKPHAGGWTALP